MVDVSDNIGKKVMIDVTQLGWDANSAVELDHRRLRAPSVKLRSATEGPDGDVVYCIDLRITKPNVDYLSSTEMHSFEHFLLAGFRKYLPQNFISIGLMGCQTGFYLVLLDEGSADVICRIYEQILQDILNASAVPYASVEQCGNYQNHSLELAQALATRILQSKASWRQVV
jgi:S-ribosylhomocysteine lyase